MCTIIKFYSQNCMELNMKLGLLTIHWAHLELPATSTMSPVQFVQPQPEECSWWFLPESTAQMTLGPGNTLDTSWQIVTVPHLVIVSTAQSSSVWIGRLKSFQILVQMWMALCCIMSELAAVGMSTSPAQHMTHRKNSPVWFAASNHIQQLTV